MTNNRIRRASLILTASVFLLPSGARAQANSQFWGNLTLTWARSPSLTYEVGIEPQVLVSAPAGQPDWASLETTPSIEYAAKKWLDVTGEFVYAHTKQTDDLNSNEVTMRAGARFHLLSRSLPTVIRERPRHELPPHRKVVLRDFARIEQRNIFYSNDEPTNSSWRLRNRLEFQLPLNRQRITDDKTRYVLSDWEWFIPLNDDPKERFANKQRIRLGFGYRQNFTWRYEVLYIWGRSLDATTDSFTTSDNIVNLRVKRVF